MAPLFVVSTGGTGAKVFEALIHLCAAGLGPEEIHVLMVDGDSTNGNRLRAEDTAATYSRIQEWPWRVAASTCDGERQMHLFRSKVKFYALAARFTDDRKVGLEPHLLGDDELLMAMRVLLDEDELKSDLSQGFTGRPNLGSVVMEQHLEHYLSERTRSAAQDGQGHNNTRLTAKDWVDKLIECAAPPNSHPRVVVVGSIFGGTGASMFPVAKRCIQAQFLKDRGTGSNSAALFPKLRWAKVMQLPYFRPMPGAGMKKVNPHRHLMDTSSALWYYGLLEGESDVSYLIGSEDLENKVVPGFDGGALQMNPPLYHELLAALAILDFHANPEPTIEGNVVKPVRHCADRSKKEECTLTNLPTPSGMKRKDFLDGLGALFHLGGFVLLATGEEEQFRQGLFQYSLGARLTGWNSLLHERFCSQSLTPKNPNHEAHHALLYFGRLMYWGAQTLASREHQSSGLVFDGSTDYVCLHNTMCHVDEAEVCVGDDFRHETDNYVAQLCRTVVASLLRDDASHNAKLVDHPFGTPTPLVENNRIIRCRLPEGWITSGLRHFEVLKDDDLQRLEADYFGRIEPFSTVNQ